MLSVVSSRAFLAIALLGSVLTLAQPSANAAKPEQINFKLLYHAAQLSNQAYDGKSEILGKHSGRKAWVATPGRTDVQYVLLQNDKRKVQAIAVRGTDNDTNWDLDMDTRGIKDQKAGILMHRGFRAAAEVIYRDVKPRLKPGYTTYLTGHSLGGAVAAIVGIYLLDDSLKLGGIFTFGQPKFTNIAGAKAYAHLPLLRVVYQNDTVAFLPAKVKRGKEQFVHIGPVINLLSGPYYIFGNADQTLRFSQGSFKKLFGQISVPDHEMKWYLRNLREKVDGATRVSPKDRNKYIVRHKRGQGEPIKRSQNFNRKN